MEEISREYYLVGNGLKATADLQPIYDRYAAIIGSEALHLVREEMDRTPARSEERRQTRMLLEWLADLQSSRELAPLEERELAWESSAVIHLEGRDVEYQQVSIAIANTSDRRERLRIERARNRLVASELAPLRRERFTREREILNELHLGPSYDATFEALSGIPLETLADQCEALLEATEAVYEDTCPRFVRKVLNIEPRDATRADAAV